MKIFIKQKLRENLSDDNIIRLYHRISGHKKNMSVPELIKSVFKNGLMLHNNGEVGNVIWFSPNYDDYAKNGQFVVAYDYDKTKNYEENNSITYFGTPFGNEPIPFNKLVLIKVPVMETSMGFLTNEDLIRLINVNNFTPDKCNNMKGEVIIYSDLFNMYVQPKINFADYLNGIDQSKIKLINVLK